MYIGTYKIDGKAVLAPMAGVTDRPFRQLCKQHGAALVVSEMVTSDTRLWNTRKSKLRLDHSGEIAPRSVQIAGGDAAMMADATRQNIALGAQIIDINMGCPAKKVCKKAAGSALLKDQGLVQEILLASVEAAGPVPVTLKIRTGWSPEHRNGATIARIAEDCGISALAVHGRTRSDAYKGEAEYDTIAAIAASVDIPVFANGDIDSPEKAAQVLAYTGADAVMIGRAAQGKPWLFEQINQYLSQGIKLADPTKDEIFNIMSGHIQQLYAFYGEYMGVRIARKHVGWYLQQHQINRQLKQQFNQLESANEQQRLLAHIFDVELS
ncbi:tRNA-U20-dihydrouridine synthase [Sinobacterium caligoides]|uniref:tRNA-dihydrouridine synthase B n=1 Tax=Sinobacterium caligoides TaxID=933926 RepID=A0A3N2DPF1_9GAMM|nr:tRNA dihydrouridine synthase DusB [Sinobacterium caligoides]ROS01529.1 tRNA-U20-dihydrouridine synthase [Sinobacterium caligoides]